MRDKEFSDEFVKLAPRLEMYFVKRMQSPVSLYEKVELAKELVQETAMKALEYSRKEKYSDRSIEKLLFQKADNVWKDHVAANKRQRNEKNELIEDSVAVELNAQQKMEYVQTLEVIQGISNKKAWLAIKKKEEGYSYSEIALEIGVTEETLRQMISRQKRKIAEKYYSLKYF
jgi:RNA polymerase sigma factor (sigma-70 family)